jgi:hypothetical protein
MDAQGGNIFPEHSSVRRSQRALNRRGCPPPRGFLRCKELQQLASSIAGPVPRPAKLPRSNKPDELTLLHGRPQTQGNGILSA